MPLLGYGGIVNCLLSLLGYGDRNDVQEGNEIKMERKAWKNGRRKCFNLKERDEEGGRRMAIGRTNKRDGKETRERKEGDKNTKGIKEGKTSILPPVISDGPCASYKTDENLRVHYKNLRRHGDLAPGICVGLVYYIILHIINGS
jgi:hypothetical protein